MAIRMAAAHPSSRIYCVRGLSTGTEISIQETWETLALQLGSSLVTARQFPNRVVGSEACQCQRQP